MKRFFSLLLLLSVVVSTRAQLVFAVDTTASSTGHGYTAGQAATFVFTVTGADLSGNPSNQFFSYNNLWDEEATSDTAIFTAITGTGITGAFTRPHLNANDPNSYVQAMAPTGLQLTLQAGADSGVSGSNIGLVANGTSVIGVIAGNLDWGQSFATPQTYTPLASYFNSYLGTHALISGSSPYFTIYLAGGPTVDFVANSVTISAIPEPAHTAVTFSVVGLAAVLALRKRRRARLSPVGRQSC